MTGRTPQELVLHWNKLKAERAQFERTWQEIADYVRPLRAEFTSVRVAGDKRNGRIFDATPLMAADSFAGGIYGMMTNPANRWFALRLQDDDLNDYDPVRDWLYEVEGRILHSFGPQVSRFYSVLPSMYADLACFGTAIFYSEEIPGQGRINDNVRPLSECVIAESAYGEVDTVYRRFALTGKQAIEMFADGLSERTARIAEKDPFCLIHFIHCVYADEANASNKVTLQSLIYNLWNNFLQDTAPDHAADFLVTRDVSAVAPKKVLVGQIGIGKETIWIPAAALIPRITSGAAAGSIETATNKIMIKTLDFDPNTSEFAQVAVQMPKSWDEGNLTALFVWSHAATATNFTVRWGIRGLALSDNEAIDGTALTTAGEIDDTGGVANNLYRSAETPAFALNGGVAEGDVAIFEIYRNATAGTDTMAIDARLHGVALFLTTNANTDN